MPLSPEAPTLCMFFFCFFKFFLAINLSLKLMVPNNSNPAHSWRTIAEAKRTPIICLGKKNVNEFAEAVSYPLELKQQNNQYYN